jgi:hypothetical protein
MMSEHVITPAQDQRITKLRQEKDPNLWVGPIDAEGRVPVDLNPGWRDLTLDGTSATPRDPNKMLRWIVTPDGIAHGWGIDGKDYPGTLAPFRIERLPVKFRK